MSFIIEWVHFSNYNQIKILFPIILPNLSVMIIYFMVSFSYWVICLGSRVGAFLRFTPVQVNCSIASSHPTLQASEKFNWVHQERWIAILSPFAHIGLALAGDMYIFSILGTRVCPCVCVCVSRAPRDKEGLELGLRGSQPLIELKEGSSKQ